MCTFSFSLDLANPPSRSGALTHTHSLQMGEAEVQLPLQPGWRLQTCLTSSMWDYKISFPLGWHQSSGEREVECQVAQPSRTSSCLIDAGKGGGLAPPGTHWHQGREEAGYQLPHPPPYLFLLEWCQVRVWGWDFANMSWGRSLVVTSSISYCLINSSSYGRRWRLSSLLVFFPQEDHYPPQSIQYCPGMVIGAPLDSFQWGWWVENQLDPNDTIPTGNLIPAACFP